MKVIAKCLIVLIGCLCVQSAFSQTVDEVKRSNAYYWGEGIGKTSALAEKEALATLINSISANVESKFTIQSETSGKDVKEYVSTLVQTHSNATIKNTEILSWGEEPNVHVFRFVKKAEVGKIFAERERKVKEFVTEALAADAKYQVADALRYYYWALMLLQSLPNAESVTMTIADKVQKLDVFLPKQINETISNLDFEVSDKQPDDNLTQYILGITYKKQPVANCDYSFFDGRNWSLVTGAKDGKGMAEVVGDAAAHKDLRLKIEYAFENEWKVDTEVNDVLNKVEPVIFKKSYANVSLTKSPASVTVGSRRATTLQDAVAQNDAVVSTNAVITNSEGIAGQARNDNVQAVNGSDYLLLLERVEAAIRAKNYESARDCFTADGFDIFTKLVRYGNAVILSKPTYSFVKFEDGILARSLPMRFSFSNNRRAFVEDVVFNISPDEGKICSLSFALSANTTNDIMKYQQWDEYSRLAIINFIENYKTAYALKRLDYIESIFSDNALIIVGKTVKKHVGTDNAKYTLPANQTRLTQYTKGQYMKQLSTVFKSNEYVNLKFTDTSVKKAGAGGEIYGIQLKQDYFSTTYGDTGYLFLMVDLNKPEEPTIHIRTWQPEKDPDFGLYDISNF
ncbi:hypothetical protein AGMMS49965_13710 [Bacteroidia bacterium]|nr:hypothetical protein AGMMS49965_13710 [Bacteroidia bacterium]